MFVDISNVQDNNSDNGKHGTGSNQWKKATYPTKEKFVYSEMWN